MLEERTLPSVTASLSQGLLTVNLGAASDQATIAPSGSNISVVGTNLASQSFSGVNAIAVVGTNTSSLDAAEQSVAFGGSGGTITLNTASGSNALDVSGVTTVSFNNVTINATSGNINVVASETTSATNPLTSTTYMPQASVNVTGATIEAHAITLDAAASATDTTNGLLGGVLDPSGVAAAIANLKPNATITVAGTSTIQATGSGGSVTIAAASIATINATPTITAGLLPADAVIATSIVNSTAVAHVGGSSTVNAGNGILNITSTNTTNITANVTGSSSAGGVSVAVSIDKSTTQAYVDGGSSIGGGTVNVQATATNTANTTATSSAQGGASNSEVSNDLTGNIDPTDSTDTASPAKSSAGSLSVAGALAVTKFTPTTQAYVDSSTVTATSAINIDASSDNNAPTVANGSQTSDTSKNGVGVAIAINDINANNTATVFGPTTLSAPTIMVQATTPTANSADVHTFSASATSGASGTNVGVAGALALNIVSNISTSSLSPLSVDGTKGTVLTLNTATTGSDISFLANDNSSEVATATGTATGGGKVGVGASVALNIVTNKADAQIGAGATLTGAHNVTLNATSDNPTTTSTTAAGSASAGTGVGISPAIAVVNSESSATLGAANSGPSPNSGTSLAADAAATDPSIIVANTASFPTTLPFVIQLNQEQMLVTGAPATTLTNAVGLADPSISVASTAGMPISGSFVIQIDQEQILVTLGPAANTLTVVSRGYHNTTPATHNNGANVLVPNDWLVTRGFNGTTSAAHNNGAGVAFVPQVVTSLASAVPKTPTKPITVTNAVGFPNVPFTIQIDQEQMTVTKVQGTTWTVTRGQTPAAHNSDAVVLLIGGASGLALTATGAVSLTAQHFGNSITTANGSATGSTAAIGAAIAINVEKETSTATTARDISATSGAVTIAADNAGTGTATTTASADGADSSQDAAPDSSGGTDPTKQGADGQADEQLDFAQTMAPSGDTDADSAESEKPSASTSGGKQVNVAAALSVNIVTSTAQANIPANRHVTAGGLLTVRTSNGTNALADADGSANVTPTTTLAADVPAPASGAPATSITVASPGAFPTTAVPFVPFTIQIDDEQMQVTAVSGTNNTTWTVTRGFNNTTAAMHSSGASVNAPPPTNEATSIGLGVAVNVVMANNQATIGDNAVVSSQGLTLSAAMPGSTTIIHANGISAAATSIPVAATAGFPATGQFVIQIDQEQLLVTVGSAANTLTVITRGYNGTMAAVHNNGAAVTRPSIFSAQSISGASGGTGISGAGSFALNLALDNDNEALIDPGATVTVGTGLSADEVMIAAQNNAASTAIATSSASTGGGKNIGVGASVAIDIVTNNAHAEVQNGATLSGAHDVTLSALSNNPMTTTVQAGGAATGGSDSGAGVGISVAVAVATNDTEATLGSLSGGSLTATGNFDADAEHTGSTVSSATAAAVGGKATIGAAIAVNVISDTTTATTYRDIHASGTVSLTVTAASTSSAGGTAGAQGADSTQKSSSDGSSTADGQIDDETDLAGSDAGKNNETAATKPPSVTSEDTSEDSSSDSSDSGGGGSKVGIAAAIGVNIVTSSAIASIQNGRTIASGGLLTVVPLPTTRMPRQTPMAVP